MIFVLVKNNTVDNIIVADQDFIDQNPDLYEIAVSFDEKESYPSNGFIYDPDLKVFSPVIVADVVDKSIVYLTPKDSEVFYLSPETRTLLLDPQLLLNSFIVFLPQGPADGGDILISNASAKNDIVNFKMVPGDGNQIINPLVNLKSGTKAEFIFQDAKKVWYRL